ncbi:sushi domain-containing protein 1 isoform X3 [Anarrhichthys ocellatus]|uniref:sushi domain-containing protein 1 isoform X3 n=1 Tax=Anarrhichthys ocellatus TaxID=433405 RepID=UPI0012ED6341|nr:sushi domain-containing protein 1-like isoform X3 [Anarrhichthys ocellatus]
MDERHGAMILVFLLCVIAEIPAEGHILDVCPTCHADATCDEKSDGSRKVCNCKYGFVGNGRTYCQDKDECQIGASKICGQDTTCHNTYGSYYCTCLAGYSPSNNMTVFIPNDGTHCQDKDECTITGSCGEGAQCRNLEGSFDCSCQLGYQVHNGAEPFHPRRDKASCKVVDCGQPASVKDTVLLSVTGTTYSSVAMFVCDKGFVWRSGDNSSVCGADGLWKGPNMVCEEAMCGSPPIIESTEQVWDSHSTPGSTVLYVCKEGFYNKGGLNISKCNENGQWTPPSLSCQDILCGDPPILPHTGQVWDGSSSPGSTVTYYCKIGFYPSEGNNMSLCSIIGNWTKPNISCQEVDCGVPPPIPHSIMLWDKISTLGSQVVYRCNYGYRSVGEGDVSVCTAIGDWDGASLLCTAKCGPVPFLAKSEVMWHNRSVVIHRCVDGYHSWRGSYVSVCGSSGLWQRATLRCIEIKPPVNHLSVLNEKCLHWRAEKYEEDKEVYKVTYIGSRDYERSFHDRGKRCLSSKADQLELCLNLLPVTNYSISITALSSRFTATISTNTSLTDLTVPPAPVVDYREFETPVPTLRLRRSPNTLDPLSSYQVSVLPVEGIIMFDCSSPASSDISSKSKSSTEYITAQIDVRHVGTEMNFTVGDGLHYGGFFNAPLENGRNYYIILRAVSQWKSALKSSCVLWAKVRGTSYVLRVSSLSAAAAIGLVALVILGGYCFTWFFKRT